MNLHIRQATVDDAATLARLNLSVHTVHTDERPDVFKAPVLDELIAHMRERFDLPGSVIYIAEVDGVPVGYTINVIMRRPETAFSPPRHYITVDNISVEPAYRSQGIGEALMARVYALARAEGIQRVMLTVWAFNTRAVDFYERLGFAPFQLHMEKVLE